MEKKNAKKLSPDQGKSVFSHIDKKYCNIKHTSSIHLQSDFFFPLSYVLSTFSGYGFVFDQHIFFLNIGSEIYIFLQIVGSRSGFVKYGFATRRLVYENPSIWQGRVVCVEHLNIQVQHMPTAGR